MSKNKAFEDEELEALLKEATTPLVVSKEFKKVAEEVMVTHKDTFKKLAANDTEWQQAFGISKNENGKWDVVQVFFNPNNGEARVNNVIRSESNKAVAQVRANEALSRVVNGLSLNAMTRK